MEMNFDRAVEIVMRMEGGYVNHPYDPGSETKYGISAKSYPHLDILNLTLDEAKAIYKKDFWDAIKAYEVPEPLRLLYFDAAVNQGCSRAVKLLQQVVGAEPDGVFGPKTKFAVENMFSIELCALYALARQEAYAKAPNWEHFGKGWSKRLLEIYILSKHHVSLLGRV